jgi:tRNA A-37 threonylcarbamoyl transferase component Bud32
VKNYDYSLIRIREGNLSGVLNAGVKSLLTTQLIDDLDRRVVLHGGRVLKNSILRWAATLPVEDGKTLFIKKFRVLSGLQGLKHLIRSSGARREWRVSNFLSQEGILTPTALGILERRRHGILKESFFITEGLDVSENLIDFCKNRRGTSNQKKKGNQILRLLAETTRKIHDIGLFHRDFHGGNFLVTDGDSPSLYVVDLHTAQKQRRVSHAKRLWNLAQIFYVLSFMLNDEAKELFLLAYGRGQIPFGKDLPSCLKKVERIVQKVEARRQKKSAAKCLKEGTLFTKSRRAGLRIYRRREMEHERLMAILEAHRERVTHPYKKKRHSSSKPVVSTTSSITVNGGQLNVKQYQYENLLGCLKNIFRQPEGKSSWIKENLMFRRGVCTVKPLAYVEKCRLGLVHKAFYVSESPAGEQTKNQQSVPSGDHALQKCFDIEGHCRDYQAKKKQ